MTPIDESASTSGRTQPHRGWLRLPVTADRKSVVLLPGLAPLALVEAVALAELQSGGEKTGRPSVTCPQQARVKWEGRSGSGAEGKRSATASKAKAVRTSLSDNWRRALRSSTASASADWLRPRDLRSVSSQAEARRRTASKAPSCSRSTFPAPKLKESGRTPRFCLPIDVRPRDSRCLWTGLAIQLMRASRRTALCEGSTRMTS
jgi:hypothetical protein